MFKNERSKTGSPAVHLHGTQQFTQCQASDRFLIDAPCSQTVRKATRFERNPSVDCRGGPRNSLLTSIKDMQGTMHSGRSIILHVSSLGRCLSSIDRRVERTKKRQQPHEGSTMPIQIDATHLKKPFILLTVDGDAAARHSSR